MFCLIVLLYLNCKSEFLHEPMSLLLVYLSVLWSVVALCVWLNKTPLFFKELKVIFLLSPIAWDTLDDSWPTELIS